MQPRPHLTAAAILTLCPAAQAEIGLPIINPAPIPTGTLIREGGGATLDNYVSQDLVLPTTADWTVGALVLELTAGSIYQDVAGDANGLQPNPIIAGFPGFESLQYDTFITNPDGSEFGGGAAINGWAGDLNSLNYTFNGTAISVSWVSPGADQDDIGNNRIARFTLSDDAQGTWSLAATVAFNPVVKFLDNPIINGQLISDPLQGDLNFDGFVGIQDLNTVLGVWNQSPTPGDRTAGDPSGDGFVGIEDLNILLGNWNAGLVPLVPGSNDSVVRDYNLDGFVGLDDQNILNSNWNQNVTPGDISRGDGSGDGFIGIEDKVNSNWNAGTPPQPVGGGTPPGETATIPEPATLGVLVIAGCVILRRSKI